MYVILNKTIFGYEQKACGFNRNASEYAGISSKRSIVLSMVIAGALSGIGGGLYYLAGTGQYSLLKALVSMGFNGIPVALLASSNPIGTIFSALFRLLYSGRAATPCSRSSSARSSISSYRSSSTSGGVFIAVALRHRQSGSRAAI